VVGLGISLQEACAADLSPIVSTSMR